MTITISVALLGASIAYANIHQGRAVNAALPPQSVLVDPKSFAVLPDDFSYRTDSFNQHFNPTNSQDFPTFQVFNGAFLDIIGSSPSISEIASNSSFAFAHEAPVYIAETDEVFFASNDGGPLGMSDINHNNAFFKLNLTEAEQMLSSGGSQTVNVPITQIPLPDSIQMTNGATGPSNGNLILANSGRGTIPSTIALVNSKPPHNATVILNNYFGRQFNSLNDVKVHPTSGNLFFTDTIYGFLNRFRDTPLLPGQVYRFDMDTSAVRVVADNIDKPNGIAFTADGKTAYIADTGASGGKPTEPGTVYAFDVDPTTETFLNRRILAYIDAGVPDGLQVDVNGNVYTACADGVQVFAADGTLLGKFFLDISSANMVFAGPGRMVILAETKVFLAKIAPTTKGVVS
ncbi:hypothetical protein AGABI1DRAFT_130338 [Agaricus bisporus var. burnettii JB137-S8]|uniref:SMP-30/Gluconolactonase/LRE-like region domain-containing protein n=1 Tax=Agaricus bisporus var. burnettii (strain JB137-S8 / ATCC MYA-4627 / FGSC 10392) TaxID=597362 RepID=K5VT84_AGABU|nr:uncharacterized protein AGABI1DRAFT_130338 [Agaricus bisporus var. burnettii JB137-S8]EKM77649.1 hypothetical protein AGABI1DRAFT_130338 [Agaricus bisporus var. burnettii JB137-S8]